MLSRSNSAKIFRLENADRTEVAGLLANGMPGGASAESWLQRFSQWWDRNPHAPNDWPRGCVIRKGDRIVGAHAWVPLAYWIEGRVHTACAGTTWFVDPEYRASAFGMALRFKSAPADILIASSAIPAVAKVLEALHFQRIHPQPDVILGKTLDYASLVRHIAGQYGAGSAVQEFAGLVVRPMAILPSFLARRRIASDDSSDSECSVVSRIDSGFDRLWEQLRTHQRPLLIRDAETVAWYAFDPAVADQRMLVACRDRSDRWLGYALFNVYKQPGIEQKRATLIDMVVDPAAPGAIQAIANEAVAAARRQHLWQIDFSAFDECQLARLSGTRMRARKRTRRIFLFVRPEFRASIRGEDFYFTGLDGDGGLN